jgi:non-ribosomal peptide synthetase component F
MRPIVYSIVTTATAYALGVTPEAFLGTILAALAALAVGTVYMNRDGIARDLTRRAFRTARRFERGTSARRAMFRAARAVEAYARKAEAEIRADGIA